MTFFRPLRLRFVAAAILCATNSMAFADGFSAVAPMHQARFGHTATLLQDGKVLVTGGGTISDLLATSELYDPVSNSWSSTGSLKTAREYHTATLLTSGKVLVVGGSQFGVPLQSAEIYDPATGTWSPAGTPTSKRENHSATLLPSGKVFVAFGTTGNNGATPTASAELYNPSTNGWTSAGNAPGGGGARSYHQAALVASGTYVVAFGGADAAGNPRNDGAMYNTSTSWTGPFGLMATARYLFTATASADFIVAAGGYTSTGATATAEYYDASTNQWHSAGTMTSARYGHAAVTLDAIGSILVTGGVATNTSLASAEIYSPVTNTWTATGNSMSTGRAQHTATSLGFGRVLVCGGQTGSGSTAVETATCDEYIVDPIYRNGFE